MDVQTVKPVKYVFVTGGPMSGIGKGIIASSIAMMLGWNNIPTTAIKIDGYLNYDADTMSPYEHGEAYVTADGGVSDLDLGNYERFVGLELSRSNSITMGKIYAEVARKERAGEYNGKTVQIVPHVTDTIKDWIRRVANSPSIINDQKVQPQVCIVEIGGTVGDIETLPVFHAIKQMIYEETISQYNTSVYQKGKMCFVHVTHLSYVGSSDGDREEKTKPTQHNVELLRSLGISPNIMVVRCEKNISQDVHTKMAIQCLVPHIINSYNVPNIHCVPEVLYKQNISDIIGRILGFEQALNMPIPNSYNQLLDYFKSNTTLNIGNEYATRPKLLLAIVGKYTGINDTYLSLIRAIQHAAFAHNVNVTIEWIDAKKLYEESDINLDLKYYHNKLGKFHGILVPGGFGSRGINGMMAAARYARKYNKPYFGICLGMQIMISEFTDEILPKISCKDMCPHSSEWCNLNHHNISHTIQLLPGQKGTQSGSTMRLGNYTCTIEPGTIAYNCYNYFKQQHATEGKFFLRTSNPELQPPMDKFITVNERHRHRYEVNNDIVGYLEDEGLIFSGTHYSSEHGILREIVELSDKKFHLGCQFHPEFLSRHWSPHPLFYGFIAAMMSEAIH
jgi:CTP synthase